MINKKAKLLLMYGIINRSLEEPLLTIKTKQLSKGFSLLQKKRIADIVNRGEKLSTQEAVKLLLYVYSHIDTTQINSITTVLIKRSGYHIMENIIAKDPDYVNYKQELSDILLKLKFSDLEDLTIDHDKIRRMMEELSDQIKNYDTP